MSDAPLTLYHYWRSSCSWRVRWALLHKEIPYQSKTINLLAGDQFRPEYQALSPQSFVPCLVHGTFVLSESLAILEYLEERWPASKPLLPSSASDRSLVRQLALTIVAGTQPLQNMRVARHYSAHEGEREQWIAHWIRNGLGVYESLLQRYGGSFSFGGTLTIADLCLIPQCYNALRYHVALDDFPITARIYRHCLTLDSCRRSAPEAHQPDEKPAGRSSTDKSS